MATATQQTQVPIEGTETGSSSQGLTSALLNKDTNTIYFNQDITFSDNNWNDNVAKADRTQVHKIWGSVEIGFNVQPGVEFNYSDGNYKINSALKVPEVQSSNKWFSK
ncbi:hypothetical protein [Limosilactobacillus caecicola]|uniref:hypothetical protein n=1 Tax=Limosilactobacillus caecicola TaxID=2941332 RepID=UPI0020414F22|nr:hypothetical protein [Limosilactobacillus caecicola]